MTKSIFLILIGLLVFSGVKAQTDSNQQQAERPAGDTTVHKTVVRRDTAIHHLSHRDSVRRDSIIRERRRVKDSLARVQQAAGVQPGGVPAGQPGAAPGQQPSTTGQQAVPDTAHRIDTANSAAIARPDTIHPTASSATVVHETSPPAITFWHKVLAANPYFPFTAPPVVEIYQVHKVASKDTLFYLIVGILFYFALIRVFFEKYFGHLMTLFFRVSLRQQQIREQVLQTPLPSLLLNILFVISAGLHASFVLHYSNVASGIRFWVLYMYCMGVLAAIYLLKFLMLKFVGWVFSISRATDVYIFIVFLVNKMLGIFLLPFLIIITFSGPTMREIFITISLAMVFVLWMYRVLAAYRPIRNEIKLTAFYFFLYLCAFEIAPLLLIYKVLLSYLEKVY